MKSEDWERRRLAGETPALPGGRGGSMRRPWEFSFSLALQRLMRSYVGCYFFNGLLTLMPTLFCLRPAMNFVKRRLIGAFDHHFVDTHMGRTARGPNQSVGHIVGG